MRRCFPALLLASILTTRAAESAPEIAAGFDCTANDIAALPPEAAEALRLRACAALRKASGGRGYFSISGERDDNRYLLTVARVGTTRAVTGTLDVRSDSPLSSRRLERLAAELVQHRPVEEARPPRAEAAINETALPSRQGLIAIEGIALTPGFLPLSGAGIALGGSVAYRSATPRWAFGGEAAIAGRAGDAGGMHREVWYGSLATGVRGFLSSEATSPFLGAGVGALVFGRSGHPSRPPLETSAGSTSPPQRRWGVTFGPATFVELGVATARTSDVQLVLALRADLPLVPYEEKTEEQGAAPRDLTPAEQAARSTATYVVPVSLRAGVQF